MFSSDCGKQQVAVLAARPADLREQERLTIFNSRGLLGALCGMPEE